MNQHSIPASVSEYATKTKQQLFMASLQARIAVEEAKVGAKLEDKFSQQIRAEIEVFYAAALNHAESNPALQSLLKEAHAYWLACVESVFPNTGEATAGYESRLGQMAFEHSVRANRVCLGP